MNTKPALFIDRDGTMGGSDYAMSTPQMYFPFSGTKEAFSLLHQAGFPLYIVTNQSCIARKLDGGYDFAAEFRAIGADDWFICPHDSIDHCTCRKPETGLLVQAQKKHNLNLIKCYMIGDRWSDMAAGGKMGMKLILVQTGRGQEALQADRFRWANWSPEFIAKDLLDAAKWLLKQCP